MEETLNKLYDFYLMVKIHALSLNSNDPLMITSRELQGLLRCYLQCMESIIKELQEER